MSYFDLPAVFSRRRSLAGAAAASAVLAGLLLGPLPAQAQINGWMNQMNPWGPTYNQHTATNIMTPHMNSSPLPTPSQSYSQNTFRQYNSQPNYPQAYSARSYYPQMPSSNYQSYPTYQQYSGPATGNQYQGQTQSSPIGQPVQTRRPQPPTSTTGPNGTIVRTGPGGIKVTIYPQIHGGVQHLQGSNIQIHGIGIDTPYGYQNNFPYPSISNGPALLGGYYYGNYTDTCYAGGGYVPSIYSVYSGFPQYIYNVGTGLTVVGDPYYPVYATSYLPFSAPTEPVTYNQNNYQTNYNYQTNNQYNYYGDGQKKQTGDTTEGRPAVPVDSYQAAFGDIEQAWKNGDLSALQNHIRDTDTRISVYFKGKYSYSIASGDFVQITRDAFDRLHTVSFEFTRLRKAKNGDVTAYGKQVYRTGDVASDNSSDDLTAKGDTVPFRTDGTQSGDDAQPYDRASDPTTGQEKTVYVSYILRRYGDHWDIIGIDTSPTELAK
jgi:hypothetical protein